MPLSAKSTFRMLLSGFVLGALVLLAYEFAHWFTHVYESGARVQTELTRISSRVDGTVKRILVQEGDRVKAGQPLIELVDEDIRLNIETLRADLALEEARRKRLVSEHAAFEVELESRLATRRKQIQASEVEHRAVLDRLQLAQKDLRRVRTLFNKELASAKNLATEQDKVLILQGEASRLAAKIEIAKSELDQVASTRKQLEVIGDRINISRVTTEKIKKTIEREEVSLGFRQIASPLNGVIDRVYKHKGEYVEEGERILILHDENVFWVEAFVTEDQIRHVRAGQTVAIHLEAYPFKEYNGTVLAIGSATTEQMGLSTGGGARFGRPEERVPIKVSVDNPHPNLAPGMLAKINIRIYDSIRLRSVFDIFKTAQPNH